MQIEIAFRNFWFQDNFECYSKLIMRAVLQRVSRASVTVESEITGKIDEGLLIFLGVGKDDEAADSEWLVRRVTQVRIFEDVDGAMNQSLMDIKGSALVISQFTLYGSLRKGNRPSFNRAAPPVQALAIYEKFVDDLSIVLGRTVPTGRFGTDMQIEVHHTGPVTLIVDTKERDF